MLINRTTYLFFIILSCFILLIFRIYFLQITKGEFYKNIAENQYFITIKQHPTRGEIFDRFGFPIAINKDFISAFIVPRGLIKKNQTLKFIKDNFEQAYKRYEINPSANFMYIKRKLSEEEIIKIEQANLPDIKFLTEPARYYISKVLGPVCGLTNLENNGLFGLELMYNHTLSGSKGIFTLQKEARSGKFFFKKETQHETEQPSDLTTTLDSNLQFLVYNELKKSFNDLNCKEGYAIVVDPTTGDILSLVNYPDFDPNNTNNLDIEFTKNRACTNSYELGSVIKIFLALAALEENVVEEEELIDCGSCKEGQIDGIKFTTTKANGIIPFSDVIRYSNNFGVAKVGKRLGIKLFEHYNKLGFGKKTGLFFGENKGFINPPKLWSRASIFSLSFGYEISATILQLAQAFTVIVNDGLFIPLKIDTKEYKKIKYLYKKETTDTIKKILKKVITSGTGKLINIPGYNIYGKTGTARLITNGAYDKDRLIYTFACAIEHGNYKRVVVTMLKESENPKLFSADTVVPLSKRIIEKIIIKDKLFSKIY